MMIEASRRSDAIHIGQCMALMRRGFLPLAQRGIFERKLKVSRGCRTQFGAIGLKTKRDRREHGIGEAEIAEQPAAARPKLLTAAGPNLIDAGYIGLEGRGQRHTPLSAANVH